MHDKNRFSWKTALKLLLILAAIYVVVVSCVIYFGDIYELVFLDGQREAYNTSESNNTATSSTNPAKLPTQTTDSTQTANPSQTSDPTQTTVPTQTTNPSQTTGPKPTADTAPTATPLPHPYPCLIRWWKKTACLKNLRGLSMT